METEEERRRRLTEFAARGEAAMDQYVRPHLRPEDDGKFVVVDPASGDYEMDHDEMTASKRLRARRPTGMLWIARAGHRAAYRFGGVR